MSVEVKSDSDPFIFDDNNMKKISDAFLKNITLSLIHKNTKRFQGFVKQKKSIKPALHSPHKALELDLKL